MSGLNVLTREYAGISTGTITFTHTPASCELSFEYRDAIMQKMSNSADRIAILKAYLKEVEATRLNCTQFMGWGEWCHYKLQRIASSIHIIAKGALTSSEFWCKENSQKGTLILECTSDIISVDCIKQYFAEYDHFVKKRQQYFKNSGWGKVMLFTGLLGCLAAVAALQKGFFTAKLNS